MQQQIDEYHKAGRPCGGGNAEYLALLRGCGYLVAEGDDFSIGTQNVDDEIALIASPQLVVPVNTHVLL